MNMSAAEWLDIIWRLGMALFAAWLYLDRRNDKTDERVSKMEKRLDDDLKIFGNRLTRIETEIDNQPTSSDLSEVYREMRKMAEGMAQITASFTGLNATLNAVKEQVKLMDSFWRSR